jgi:putative membrane protein
MRLSDADHTRVTAAVKRAEAQTDGEIVTIVTRRSDGYTDVALHWAVLAMLFMLAVLAAWPGMALWIHAHVVDAWAQRVPPAELFAIALVLVALKFLLFRLLLAWMPLRMALVPGAIKSRRVRDRSIALFRVGAEKRTRARTGVLLYVSLAEHRAEIVADESIASKVEPEVWGEAMAALVVALKDGRPGDGMAAAVERIGVVLAEHFPRSSDDINELPDRLIEL